MVTTSELGNAAEYARQTLVAMTIRLSEETLNGPPPVFLCDDPKIRTLGDALYAARLKLRSALYRCEEIA